MKYKTLRIIQIPEEDPDIINIPESRMLDIIDPHIIEDKDGNFLLQVKIYDPLANKGFYLDGNFDWVLGQDPEQKHLVLIPLKKGESK